MKTVGAPLVSIIMTSYNYEQYIGEAIDSVFAQEYTNWELIVADDGSWDKSPEIIKNYAGRSPGKIIYCEHPGHENRNIKETLELGISKAKGEYIAFLESDDIWEPSNLKEKVQALENNKDVWLVFSDLKLLAEKGAGLSDFLAYRSYIRYAGRLHKGLPYNLMKILLIRNPFGTLSNLAVRAGAVERLNLSAEFQEWSDWQVALHAGALGQSFYIGKPLILWRVHKDSAHARLKSRESVELANVKRMKFKSEMEKRIIELYREKGMEKELNLFEQYINSTNELAFNMTHNLRFGAKYPLAVLRKLFGR